jgi:hypothetical protein
MDIDGVEFMTDMPALYQMGMKDRRVPLTLDMHYDALDHPDENWTCVFVGQNISRQGNYTCLEDDILNDEFVHMVKEDGQGIALFFQSKYFGLTSTEEVWVGADGHDGLIPRDMYRRSGSHTALRIVPTSGLRPGVMATAQTTAQGKTGAPLAGVIQIDVAQYKRLTKQKRLNLLAHESDHILSFSPLMVRAWAKKYLRVGDTTRHSRPLYLEFVHDGRLVHTLYSEESHKVVAGLIGSEWMYGGENKSIHVLSEGWNYNDVINAPVPASVELERGEFHDRGAHVSDRTYFGEITGSAACLIHHHTSVTDSFFRDTGWYAARERIAAPTYGNWRMVEGATPEDFQGFFDGAIGTLNLPQYVARTGDVAISPRCTYDLRAVGSVPAIGRLSEVPDWEWQALHKDFVDPTGTGYYGLDMFDFTLISAPLEWCDDAEGRVDESQGWARGAGTGCALSNLSLPDGSPSALVPGCFKMRCDGNWQVVVSIDGVERVCDSREDWLSWPPRLGLMQCPDASILCGPLHPSTEFFRRDTNERKTKSWELVVAGIVIGVVGAYVMGGLGYYVYRRFKPGGAPKDP